MYHITWLFKHLSRLEKKVKSASGRGGGGGGISIVNPKKLETRSRTNSAGIPYTLLLRTEAIGFPTFGR